MLPLCDVVYASDKASFFLPYAQLAQTPEGCASYTLPQALGMAMVSCFFLFNQHRFRIKIFERKIVNISLPFCFNMFWVLKRRFEKIFKLGFQTSIQIKISNKHYNQISEY